MRRILYILVLVCLATPARFAFAQAEDDVTVDDAPEPNEAEATPDPFDEIENELVESGPLAPDAEEKPIQLMTRTELSRAGFEFGEEESGKDTSAALLLAVTGGALVHGVGHFYLGDPRTGWTLLGMEAVSVGLMMSAATFYGVTQGSSPWAAMFGPMMQAGLAGFVFSYLADVLGTLTIEDKPLDANVTAETGVGFQARYGFLSASGVPVRHVIDARLVGNAGGVYGSVATTQDVFLDLASYRGKFGVRPLRGGEPLTFLAIEGNGDYLQWQGDGEFGRIGADGRLIVSYQFGNRVPHLSEFALGAMAGVGNRWLQIAPRGTNTFEATSSRLQVPFDAWASLNVSRHLNVRGGYGTPEVALIPSLHRLLGVVHVDFVYRSDSIGDLSLRAEMGDGFALWFGGGLWFGR